MHAGSHAWGFILILKPDKNYIVYQYYNQYYLFDPKYTMSLQYVFENCQTCTGTHRCLPNKARRIPFPNTFHYHLFPSLFCCSGCEPAFRQGGQCSLYWVYGLPLFLVIALGRKFSSFPIWVLVIQINMCVCVHNYRAQINHWSSRSDAVDYSRFEHAASKV